MKRLKSVWGYYFFAFVFCVALLTPQFIGHNSSQPSRYIASVTGSNCLDAISQLTAPRDTYADATGSFLPASKAEQDEVITRFRELQRSGSFAQKLDPDTVRRVSTDSIKLDLNRMSKGQLDRLYREGLKDVHKLVIFKGGAGLWSRGGGKIKALVPYNIKAVVGDAFEQVAAAGDVFGAKSNEDILKLKGISTDNLTEERVEFFANQIRDEAKSTSNGLTKGVEYHPDALTPLDLEFVNLAIWTEYGEKFVPYVIGTSHQTHGGIFNYIEWLKEHLDIKTFNPDEDVDRKIKLLLKKYFNKADELDHSFMFGYQRGIHAIDVESAEYLTNTPRIGRGAGTAAEYLQDSGLADKLAKIGVEQFAFENVEIVSNFPLLYGAYMRGNNPIAVTLVPQKENYKGGNGFWIKKGDKWLFQLLEQSVLTEEFAEGNEWFNSNSIIAPLFVERPKHFGFELKEQGTIARVKENMGNLTFDSPTTPIGGRIGPEYENWKSFREYGENGERYILMNQKTQAEMLKH